MAAIYSEDPNFCFASRLCESIATENLGVDDLGPTENLPPDVRDLLYRCFFGSSPLTSPCPSSSPSRSSSRSASPHRPDCPSTSESLGHLSHSPTLNSPSGPSKPQNSNTKRNKARGKEGRRKGRREKKEETRSRPFEIRDDTFKKCVEGAQPAKTTYECENLPTASTGYIGLPDHHERKRTYSLKEYLEDLKFKLQEWDGKTPLPIVDARGRIIAVLAGRPDNKDWHTVDRKAAEAVHRCRKRCRFPKKARVHRRGTFPALNLGISYGGGQKKPGNLFHSERNKEALSALAADESIARIVKYANSAFATWAPNLYTYYEDHFEPLLTNDPTLRRNWPDSVWASFAVNFGPYTVCRSHRDFANLPFGWCSITSLGDFDAKKGGHLVLWDLKLVIEFPPGSTILIPSSTITHSNVPIGQHETRYSITQFSAGGLFRWVDQGFQCTDGYLSNLTSKGKEEESKRQEERCRLGLSLFSTMESLPGDREVRNRHARASVVHHVDRL